MKWTKTPPTEPGRYWMDDGRISVVRIWRNDGEVYMWAECQDWASELPLNAKWAGPIPEPEEPGDANVVD